MDLEISAMSKVAEALEGLEADAIRRVLRWAADKYEVEIATKHITDFNSFGNSNNDEKKNNNNGKSIGKKYETLADLFNDASPSTHAEKVLIAGYWHQVIGEQSYITSRPLNKDLKDLGHAVANISERFDTLMSTKPQLAIQLKKLGNSKQARKQYKITKAGIAKVDQMLEN